MKKDIADFVSMLDLSAGEGLETAPSKTATTLKGPSVEIRSSLYAFYLGHTQDQAELQRNLGSC